MDITAFVERIIEQAPTLAALIYLVWRQQSIIENLINDCIMMHGAKESADRDS